MICKNVKEVIEDYEEKKHVLLTQSDIDEYFNEIDFVFPQDKSELGYVFETQKRSNRFSGERTLFDQALIQKVFEPYDRFIVIDEMKRADLDKFDKLGAIYVTMSSTYEENGCVKIDNFIVMLPTPHTMSIFDDVMNLFPEVDNFGEYIASMWKLEYCSKLLDACAELGINRLLGEPIC